jgi:hypothetical protein
MFNWLGVKEFLIGKVKVGFVDIAEDNLLVSVGRVETNALKF